MPFASCANYLCDHNGADKSNQDFPSLGERFLGQNSQPVDNLKGEESALFLVISTDGPPLFLHNVANLDSTRRAHRAHTCGSVGLQKSTTIIALMPRDCFTSIPSGRDSDINSDFFVPPFLKLASLSTALACQKSAP